MLQRPSCAGMRELDFAQAERDSLNANHDANGWTTPRLSLATDVIQLHILQGLAVTAGSAYGEVPPCREMCWTSFIEEHTKQDKQAIQMHKGGRAFTKHSHRDSSGWWGVSTGTNSDKNAMAERVFNLIWNGRCAFIRLPEAPAQKLIMPTVLGQTSSGCLTVS